MRALLAVVAVAALAIAAPAHAEKKVFTVSFKGSGSYSSFTHTETSRAYTVGGEPVTGTCDYDRTENTGFSWEEKVPTVTLTFNKKGAVRSEKGRAIQYGAHPNSSKIEYDTRPGQADGCTSPSPAYTEAGTAPCGGEVVPPRGSELDWKGAAADERTQLGLSGFIFN